MNFNYFKNDLFAGLKLVFIIAILAKISAYLLEKVIPINALFFAIIYGVIFGNSFYRQIENSCKTGIEFAKKRLLRLAIVFYALGINTQAIVNLGAQTLILDFVMLSSTFLLALFLGIKILKIDKDTSILIGSGASICGAAAVLGTQSVLKSEEYKVSLAVSTVVLFGTISMIINPLFFVFNIFSLPANAFGAYIGASVHEVAQVIAAGGVLGNGIADFAVSSKMVRVILLAPFLLLLAYFLQRKKQKIDLPIFAIAFLILLFINGFLPEKSWWKSALLYLDNFILVMAMAALGISTQFSSLKQLGIKPFLLASCLFLWLSLGGLIITKLLFV